MLRDFYPVQWTGGQAVVALPEHIGGSNAGRVRDGLLSVINRGATTLIADMTATVSCDHADAGAVVRAWLRAISSGTELRLVVTARSVSRVLDLRGLVPEGLQEAHRGHRSSWAWAPSARPMGAGTQLAGLRKDGSTFPVRVSLTPVTTMPGQLTLSVIRDITRTGRLDDLAAMARDAAAARQEHLQLLDTVVTGLFHAGLHLETPANAAATQRIEAVLNELDDIIRQISRAAFSGRA